MWLVLAISLFSSGVCTTGSQGRIVAVETNITLENENKTNAPADNLHSNLNTTLNINKLLYNVSHTEEITTNETDTGNHANSTFTTTEHTAEEMDLMRTYNDTQKEADAYMSSADENNSYQNEDMQKIGSNVKPKFTKKLKQKQTKTSRKNHKRHNGENKQKPNEDLINNSIKEINVSLQMNNTNKSVEINKTDVTTEYNSMKEIEKNTRTEDKQFDKMKYNNNGSNIEKWEARELYQNTKESMYNITDPITESIDEEVKKSNKTYQRNNGTINELRKIYNRNELKENNITDEERNMNIKEVIFDKIYKFKERRINNKSRDTSNEVKDSKKFKKVGDYIKVDQGESEIIETRQINKRNEGQEYDSPGEKKNTHIEEITFHKIYNNGEHKINDINNNDRTKELKHINKIGADSEYNNSNEVRNKTSETKALLEYKINITDKNVNETEKNTSMTITGTYSKTTNDSFNNITDDALKTLYRTNKDRDNNSNISEVKNLKKDGFLSNNLNQSQTPNEAPVRQVIDYNNMMIDLISRYNAKAGALQLSPGIDGILTHRHESSFTNSKLPNKMISETVYAGPVPGKYMRNTVFTKKLMKGFLSKLQQDFDNKVQNRMSMHMNRNELSDTNSDGSNDALEVRIKKLRSQMFEILLTIEQIKRSLEEKEKDTGNKIGLKTDKRNSSTLKFKQFDNLWKQLYSNYLKETNFAPDSNLNDVIQNTKDENGSFVNMFKKLFYFLTKNRFHKIERNQRHSPFNAVHRSNLNDYAYLKANPYNEIRNLKNLMKTFNIVHQQFIHNIIDSLEEIERKNIIMIENEKAKTSPNYLALLMEKRCADMKKTELLSDAGERMARRRRNISNIEDSALRYILTLVDVLLNETPESEEIDNKIVTTDDTKKPNNEKRIIIKSQAQQKSIPFETHSECNNNNYNNSEYKQYNMYASYGVPPPMREEEKINEVDTDQLREKETESFNDNYAKETTTLQTVRSTEKQDKVIDKSGQQIITVQSSNHTKKDRVPENTNLYLETNTFQAIPARKFYFYSNDYEQDVSTGPEPKIASTEVNTLKDEVTNRRKQENENNNSDENTTRKANSRVPPIKDFFENNKDKIVMTMDDTISDKSEQKRTPKKFVEDPKESGNQEDELNLFNDKPTRIANSSFKLFRDYIDLTDDEIDRTTDIVKTITKSNSEDRNISTDSNKTELINKTQIGENTRIKYKDAKKIEVEGAVGNLLNQQYNNGFHFNSEGLLESITDEPEFHTITNKILKRKNSLLLDSLDYGLISTDDKDRTNKSNISIVKSNNKIDFRKKDVSSDEAEMAKYKLNKYFLEYQDKPAENTDAAFNSMKETNHDVNLEDKLNNKSVEEKSDSVKRTTAELESDNDKGNYGVDREEGYQDPSGDIEDSPAYF